MYERGHAGLTLFFVSFLMIPFGFTDYYLLLTAMAVFLSALPDVDMKWRRARHISGPPL